MQGKDTVLEVYSTIKEGTTFYMDMTLDDPTNDSCFSYGANFLLYNFNQGYGIKVLA